ncbi:MAG: SIR2 family protein [Oceanobacter sp.]
MAPRLMYEFPRAAMNLENKKGRKFIERFLNETYLETKWSVSPVHQWLADMNLPYIIDINRDTQLQDLYKDRNHTLIVGVARITGTAYRFRIYQFSSADQSYNEIAQEAVDISLPILFKPMGSPVPEANYIASDADYVDYITELMGGFAIPGFLKEYRVGKQYLFAGVRMQRDTERMVLSDIIYASKDDPAAYALLPGANDKELRYCKKKNITVIDRNVSELLESVDSLTC